MTLTETKEYDAIYAFYFTSKEGEHVSVYVSKFNRKIYITNGIRDEIYIEGLTEEELEEIAKTKKAKTSYDNEDLWPDFNYSIEKGCISINLK